MRKLLQRRVVALAYWLTALVSWRLALVPGQVTPIWPPTGIALVALLIFGRRVWPAIFLGALAVNLPLGPSPVGAAFIAAGNTLAPLTAAALLERGGVKAELHRLRGGAYIILVCALVGLAPSPNLGAAGLRLLVRRP